MHDQKSEEKEYCFGKQEEIFCVEYGVKADGVYVVTGERKERENKVLRAYAFAVSEGMIDGEAVMLMEQEFWGYQFQAVMAVSSQNTIAIGMRFHLYILTATSPPLPNNQSTIPTPHLTTSIPLTYFPRNMQFHPSQPQTLFIGGYGRNQVFNLKTGTFVTFSMLLTWYMNVMMGGRVVVISPYYNKEDNQTGPVRVFSYDDGEGKMTELEQKFEGFEMFDGLTAMEGNLMALVNVENQRQIHVFQVNEGKSYGQERERENVIGHKQSGDTLNNTNKSASSPPPPLPSTTPTYTFTPLQTITSFFPITQGRMSPDGNQLFLRQIFPFKKFTLCGDGNYKASPQSCEPCSPSCLTCHRSAAQYTSCQSGHYIKDEQCLSCRVKFPGCLTCSSTGCTQCVSDSYQNKSSTKCEKCSDTLQGCISCGDSEKCTQCDSYDYTLNTQTNKCEKNEWAVFVGIGVGVLLIVGIAGGAVYLFRKRRAGKGKEGDGYEKMQEDGNKGNEKKNHESGSFVKTISSERSDSQNDKKKRVRDVQSNDKILAAE